jgi:aminoglycoside phosphotransferase (APT) family kinase protein
MLDQRDAGTIAERYGLGGDASLTGPVARGEVGQVWRLTTSRGSWAVKEPFEKPSADEAIDDAAFQDLAFASGVPMPPIVRTTQGEVLADVGSSTIRVYGWVDLDRRERWLDPATVGRIVAGIHRVEYIGANPVDPWYTDPVGADRWDELIGRLTTAGAGFASQLADQRDELVALESLLEPPARLQTCHRDLFADNVLPTPSGSVCVIDWEGSGLADPSQELGLVLFEFGCEQRDRVRELYHAYLDAGGPGRIDRPESFSMIIAQLAHIGETACSRWLDPSRLADREHNAEWASEFLTQPLTRRMIDEMVDAVAT